MEGRLQALVHTGGVVLQAKMGDPEGMSFVLTPEEMRHLLDLLSQDRNIVSHGTDALAYESVQDPLDDMMASFAYQRTL